MEKPNPSVAEALKKATHSYAGFCQGCGAMCAATVDIPGFPKYSAQDVKEFIESGLRIERVTTERVRAEFGACKCHPKSTAHQGELFESEALPITEGPEAVSE